MTDRLTVSIVASRIQQQKFDDRIQAGVTLHLMSKIRLQAGKGAEALAHVQEAVTIFRETGSRHLPEADAKFLDGVCDCGVPLISKLRHDAHLRHLFVGPYPKRRGARQK